MSSRKMMMIAIVSWGAGLVYGASEQGNLAIVRAQPTMPVNLTATGRIVSTRSAKLSSRLSGRIVAWGKNSAGEVLGVGNSVEKGQVIFRIDSSTFDSQVKIARAAVQESEAVLANLKAGEREEKKAALEALLREVVARIEERRKDVDRFRRLVEEDKTVPAKRLEEMQVQLKVLEAQRDGAQARLAEAEAGPTQTEIAVAEARLVQAKAKLEAAELDLNDINIIAPFSGIITQRLRNVGDFINSAPVTEVLELVSLDDLEAELRLPETYIRKILPGKTEVILHSLLLKENLTLPVGRIIDVIDPGSGTFAFRVPIASKQRAELLPGAFIQGTIRLPEDTQDVLVPTKTVFRADGMAYVFVAEAGKMRRREVIVGDQLTEAIILKSGMKPGERVLMGSSANLQDGAPLPSYLTNGNE